MLFEGVEDGKDALATVAGLGHAILDEVGYSLEIEAGAWPASHLPKAPRTRTRDESALPCQPSLDFGHLPLACICRWVLYLSGLYIPTSKHRN